MSNKFLSVPAVRNSIMAAVVSLGGLTITSCNKDYEYDNDFKPTQE